GPAALPNLKPVVAGLEHGLATDPDSCKWQHVLGGALVRAGQWQQGIDRLQSAIQAHGNPGISQDWLFPAIAHHHLKPTQAPAPSLAKAIELQDPNAKKTPAPVLAQQQTVDMLRREVEALLNNMPVDPGK